MNRREELFETAFEAGIKIVNASPKDKNKIGIHLLKPDLDAIADALEVAQRDLFPAIYIHTKNVVPQSKFGKRWTARLNQKVWSRSDIMALTKALNAERFAKEEQKKDIQSLKSKLTHYTSADTPQFSGCWGEVFHFAKPYQITKEQSEFGIKWLRNYFLTKKGEPRMRTVDLPWSVEKVIKTFKRFEFVGVLEIKNHYGSNSYCPVYRTIGSKGQYFDYSPIHWGTPIISDEGGAS